MSSSHYTPLHGTHHHDISTNAHDDGVLQPPSGISDTAEEVESVELSHSPPKPAQPPKNPSRRNRKPFLRHLNRLSKVQAYGFLSAIAIILIVINFLEIWLFEHIGSHTRKEALMYIITYPAIVFAVLLSCLLIWSMIGLQSIRKAWAESDVSYLVARAGVVAGILLPVLLCQFWYLPDIALRDYQQIVWTTTLERSSGLDPPLLLLWTAYSGNADPLLSADVSCPLVQASQYSCASELLWIRSGDVNWKGTWVTINQRPLLGAHQSLTVAVNLAFRAPQNLNQSGGFAALYYNVVEPSFSADISQAFSGDYYAAGYEFPWDSSNAILVNYQQTTIDDMSLRQDSGPYRTYDVLLNSGQQTPVRSDCFAGSCSISITMTPSSLLTTTRRSGHGKSRIGMVLDESAIAGGVSFFAWFLTIYTI